ncbi:hypothetical protein EYF80_060908 [Liparis tanakae]|uniref:Uncharacterized protein n=1 Tax=Liparis tanakae TaxID=230148 RepID=A0A4Z2EJL6_9TELE|nr:hypothetical protein EYF80_060908 [Liparis tanakae]
MLTITGGGQVDRPAPRSTDITPAPQDFGSETHSSTDITRSSTIARELFPKAASVARLVNSVRPREDGYSGREFFLNMYKQTYLSRPGKPSWCESRS